MRVLCVLACDVLGGVGRAGDHIVRCDDGAYYLVRELAYEVIRLLVPDDPARVSGAAQPPPRQAPGLRLVR